MLELICCSMLTILPDYLFRRIFQGKRLGKEINFFTVWYELRWGITGCLMLTVILITAIFYFHPATHSATSFFRTVPILPEGNGRVSEIYVKPSQHVDKGQPIIKLDSTEQEAALETAKRRLAEVDAQMVMAQADIEASAGLLQQAQGALKQVVDELRVKQELSDRNSGTVSRRELERLQTAVTAAEGQVAAAEASKKAAETKLNVLLPAQKKSAEAAFQQAQVELDKMVIYAGVSGRVEQFILQVGDIVNPFMRPGGILIPDGEGPRRLQAGFGQMEGMSLKPGLAAEATCSSKPLEIIPLFVVRVQEYISSGQLKSSDQLVDVQQVVRPGSILAVLEPIYEGGLDDVTPGSTCIVNVYSNFHKELQDPNIGTLKWLGLHIVDTIALVHGLILRAQAVFLPVTTLVLKGGGGEH
jgi:multidrug resistance efflux pump